ncbi:MAG: hypothetical protein J6X34_03025 [Clostridia bacterium]|nr:hypothetical protein [Clostridia bacterium]
MANENDYNYRRTSSNDTPQQRTGTHSSALANQRSSDVRSAGTSSTGTRRPAQSGTGANASRNQSGQNSQNDQKKYMIRRIAFLVIALLIILLFVLAIVGIARAVSKPKKKTEDVLMKEVLFEAGEYGPAPEQLLTETGRDAVLKGARVEFETDIGQFNFHVLGTYRVNLLFTDLEGNISRHSVQIRVVDTVPPTGVAVDRFTEKGHALKVEDFISPGSVRDETDVAVSIENEPDYNKVGTQTISILLIDRGGNQTRLTASVTVTEASED